MLDREGGNSKVLTKLVGVTGVEPAASASRKQRSTKLSYTPFPLRALHFMRCCKNCRRPHLPFVNSGGSEFLRLA